MSSFLWIFYVFYGFSGVRIDGHCSLAFEFESDETLEKCSFYGLMWIILPSNSKVLEVSFKVDYFFAIGEIKKTILLVANFISFYFLIKP